jgi:hypothetical protein
LTCPADLAFTQSDGGGTDFNPVARDGASDRKSKTKNLPLMNTDNTDWVGQVIGADITRIYAGDRGYIERFNPEDRKKSGAGMDGDGEDGTPENKSGTQTHLPWLRLDAVIMEVQLRIIGVAQSGSAGNTEPSCP